MAKSNITKIQQILREKPDGIWGPKSQAALNSQVKKTAGVRWICVLSVCFAASAVASAALVKHLLHGCGRSTGEQSLAADSVPRQLLSGCKNVVASLKFACSGLPLLSDCGALRFRCEQSF
jgi:hypothetical protein